MSMEIMQDERVRSVEWRDLMGLSRWEVFHEVFISAPWLILSVMLAAYGFMPLALIASFFFFLTGLRQVHNCYHYAVGISRQGHEVMMYVLSVLMFGSLHAVQVNHLHHHAHCMDDDDVEAMSAKMPGWKAFCLGPYFPISLHIRAFQLAKPWQKRWIWAEIISMTALVILAFFVLDWMWLRYHIIAMAVGQSFTGFFAVWTVHHDCDESHHIARTQRGWLKNFISYNMFYHIEHHLFPSIPTCHLPELARRLDVAAPELKEKGVY